MKVIRGTDQPCRMNMDEAKYEALTKVSIPKVLATPRARKIFKDKSKQLISQGILQAPDIDLLTVYANTVDLYFQASEQISNTGTKVSEEGIHSSGGLTVTVHTKNGSYEMVSPYFQIMKQLIPLINSIGGEFGFSPASRASLKIEPKKNINEFEKYLQQ